MSPGHRLRQSHRVGAKRHGALTVLVILIVSCVASGRALADEVKVFCSNGYREVMQDLVPAFEKATGNSVLATFDLSTNLAKRIDAGEAFDLAVLTPALVDDLVSRGRLAATDRTTLARSLVSLAIREGRPKPDLSTTDAVTRALTTSGTIAYAKEGASAGYFLDLLKRLSLSDALAPQVRTLPSGAAVAEAVAAGEVDLGVMPVSEILPRAGVMVAGTLAAELRGYITMTAALPARSSGARAARALVTFLTSDTAGPVLERRGMQRSQ